MGLEGKGGRGYTKGVGMGLEGKDGKDYTRGG